MNQVSLRSRSRSILSTVIKKTNINEEFIPLECRFRLTVTQEKVDECRLLFGLHEDVFPITLPHILSMEAHLSLLTERRFPYPILGLIHINNTINWTGNLECKTYEASCRLENFQDHPLGKQFQIITEVSSDGKITWTETSTFLVRLKRKNTPKKANLDSITQENPVANIEMHKNIGRRYAKLSGDYNPIHLFDLTAKIFGFKKSIAHGMFTLAKVAGIIQESRPITSFECIFKAPIFLPNKVQLLQKHESENTCYAILDETGRLNAEIAVSDSLLELD